MAERENTPAVSPPPSTFDLGKPVGELHGGNEPVTWTGGSLAFTDEAEQRPTSSLARDPVGHKWMTWAIGGSLGLVAILAFALTRGGDAEAGEAEADSQTAVEIPSAPPDPEPVVVPEPVPEPKPAKKTSKKTSRSAAATSPAKTDSTFAAASGQAADSSTSKPASTSTSKPASTSPSKPASTSKPASKPAPTPAESTPTPSKPAGPNLAPPEDEGGSSKAELPDVSGWDDEDAAVGERSAEGV